MVLFLERKILYYFEMRSINLHRIIFLMDENAPFTTLNFCLTTQYNIKE